VNLTESIEQKKRELRSLELMALSATCAELGHDWVLDGGKNCGCIDGDCSIPVHKCSRCGDHDYGENAEAERTLSTCLYAIELEELEQAG
jgi:hypothetical protein